MWNGGSKGDDILFSYVHILPATLWEDEIWGGGRTGGMDLYVRHVYGRVCAGGGILSVSMASLPAPPDWREKAKGERNVINTNWRRMIGR